MKRKSVYALTAVHPRIARDCRKGHYRQNAAGEVECWNEFVGVFGSVRKAESVIRRLASQEAESGDWYSEYFGFVLEEHYLDEALYGSGKWKNVRHFESYRTYLPDGTPNCFSDLDDACEKSFAGRTAAENVKAGEIALELSGDRIVPVLVSKLALTKSEWKQRFEKGVAGDFTDDSGVAFVAGYGHCHPFSPTLFPLSCLPCYKLGKKLLAGMKKEEREYYGKGKI